MRFLLMIFLLVACSSLRFVFCRPKSAVSRDMAIQIHKHSQGTSRKFLEWLNGKLLMSLRRQIRLYSIKSKQFLQVRDKVVNAKGTPSSTFAKLIVESVGFGLVRIKGVYSNRYVCFNPVNAKLRAEKSGENLNCIFHEKINNKTLSTYYISLRQKWYIAVKSNGKMKRGKPWIRKNLLVSKRNETLEFIAKSWR